MEIIQRKIVIFQELNFIFNKFFSYMISEIIFHNESNSIYHEILPANSQFSFGHHNSSDFSRDCIDHI